MKVTFSDDDQVSIVAIAGDLIADDLASLREDIQQRIQEQKIRDFVIDMTETESIDSAGLEMLLWLQDCCAENLGQVRLASLPKNIETVLRITRLSSQIDRHSDVADAVSSLR